MADAESGGARSRKQPPLSLSAALKRETRAAHRRAENSGIIRQLIRREADLSAYICHLRNLLPVYAALESRLAALAQRPAFAVIGHPSLYRRAAIENDLAALAGYDRASPLELLPAARVYTERIESADAAGVAAHAYVRYLGDLNGGSVLKRLLRESLQLEDASLTYYDFDGIGDPGDFCSAFRRALDALPPCYDADRVIEESLNGFRLATRLSIEVGMRLKNAG